MSVVIGADLGGTKLSVAVCNADGTLVQQSVHTLDGRSGAEAGAFVAGVVSREVDAWASVDQPVMSVGLCIPGIARPDGTVWAPNIEGWTDYPLRDEVAAAVGGLPVKLSSDRSCYILGESWRGHARGVDDAVYMAVGTGIGAGIMVGGRVLEGSHGVAGAIGWMALDGRKYATGRDLGSFESQASGEGMVRQAHRLIAKTPGYSGVLLRESGDPLRTSDVFEAEEKGDPLALEVVEGCIRQWGMAVANLISIFNPEVVVLGGGVFGPAARFLPQVRAEAEIWAQPVAFRQARIEVSALGQDAGINGACRLAWDALYTND